MKNNKIDRAGLIFLSSNNYYIYMLLGIYKNLLDVKTKYPIYCGVTPDVNEDTRKLLKAVGLNLIDLDTSVMSKSLLTNIKSKNSEHYFKAFTKLTLLDTNIEQMFNKVVYIDTDVQLFENIDEVFDYPHMAAIEDAAPSRGVLKTKYTVGCSKFCSGMFVGDFEAAPGKGHEILEKLNTLDPKIAGHDQNVLNYFYQDGMYDTSLHIPPEYGAMNFKKNLDALKVPLKGLHYTSRLKTGGPFIDERKLTETHWREQNVHFKEGIEYLAETVKYFNKTYNIKLKPLHPENIILLTEAQYKALTYIGQSDAYLYF